MKEVNLEGLRKGDLIIVRWNDASEVRAGLNQHRQPEVYVKDWGVFLGIRGRKRKHVVVGKDVVETWNEWGAARIPLALIDSVTLLMRREDLERVLTEIQVLTRKARLRKYIRAKTP